MFDHMGPVTEVLIVQQMRVEYYGLSFNERCEVDRKHKIWSDRWAARERANMAILGASANGMPEPWLLAQDWVIRAQRRHRARMTVQVEQESDQEMNDVVDLVSSSEEDEGLFDE